MQNYTFVGRLTRDPELRYTANGKAVCDFGVAIQDGKDKVTFVDVTAWEKTAEFVCEYFSKGKPIAVRSARLQNQSWDDKTTGDKRTKLSVVLNEYPSFVPTSKNDSEDGVEETEVVEPAKSTKATGKTTRAPRAPKVKPEEYVTDGDEDEIPF